MSSSSRSISRPFGPFTRQSSAPPPPVPPLNTASTGSGSVTYDYVIRDTEEDTPHRIHPHAAAYVSERAAPEPPAEAPLNLRTATPEQREAYRRRADYQRSRGQGGAQPQPEPAPTASTGSTYADTAHNVDGSFRKPATATYDARTGLMVSGEPEGTGTLQVPVRALNVRRGQSGNSSSADDVPRDVGQGSSDDAPFRYDRASGAKAPTPPTDAPSDVPAPTPSAPSTPPPVEAPPSPPVTPPRQSAPAATSPPRRPATVLGSPLTLARPPRASSLRRSMVMPGDVEIEIRGQGSERVVKIRLRATTTD